MANRFAIAAGGNWSSTGTWSTTSGGAGGASVPTTADAAILDGNSGNVTVDASSVCLSLTCTGYTHTLTMNAQLAVSGSITLVSGMTLVGTTGPLNPHATGTLTSGGKTIPCPLLFDVSGTYTFADNWTVTGLLTVGSTTQPTFTSSSKTITANGGLRQGGGTSTVGGSTVKIILGGGTWDSTNTTSLLCPVDLAGNVTVSGSIGYQGGTITYVSGTITTTGSTLSVGGSSTLNTSGVTWNNLTFVNTSSTTISGTLAWSGTMTLQGSTGVTFTGSAAASGTGAISVTSTGTVTLNNTGGLVTTGTMTLPNGNVTFAGTAGFNVGALATASATASRTYTFAAGVTYVCQGNMSNAGVSNSIVHSFVSSTPGTRAVLTVKGTADIAYCNATDIDSSLGNPVFSFRGVFSNTLNWNNALNQLPKINFAY